MHGGCASSAPLKAGSAAALPPGPGPPGAPGGGWASSAPLEGRQCLQLCGTCTVDGPALPPLERAAPAVAGHMQCSVTLHAPRHTTKRASLCTRASSTPRTLHPACPPHVGYGGCAGLLSICSAISLCDQVCQQHEPLTLGHQSCMCAGLARGVCHLAVPAPPAACMRG